MKQFLLPFLFIAFLSQLHAQMPMGGFGAASVTGEVRGTVLDSMTLKPVEFATVSLSLRDFDKMVNGAVTSEKGSFKMEKVAPGKYRLAISFIGYQTKVIDTIRITPKETEINLGKIFLAPSEMLLKEVEIKGQAALIETKADKIVYNAEREISSAGATATDVLRKVPMVTVDLDGNVQLRGSGNIRILINGKPSGIMANNPADAMRMIPSDQIKSVEVITSPSAKYDAEGTAGIINIITKRKNVEGFSGLANLSAGTRLSNGNVNLNLKTGRLSFVANTGGNFFWPPQEGTNEFRRTDYRQDTVSLLSQLGKSTAQRNSVNASFGMEYEINSKNSISSNIRFNHFDFVTDGSVNALSSIQPGNYNASFDRITKNGFQTNGFDWTSDYRRTFKKPQQELSMSFQLTHSLSDNDFNTTLNALQNALSYKEKGLNNSYNNEATLQLDYTHPFSDQVILETGAKSIFRDIESDSRTERLNPLSNQYETVPGRSNILNYHQDVYAAYSVLGFQLPKQVSLKAGVRWEHTAIRGNFNTPELANVTHDYDNFIPSLSISKTFKNFNTIKLSYTQRLQRPSLFFLNPFVNAADPRNVTRGNPDLLPELAHLTEVGYSGFKGSVAYNASVYFRYTSDIIESFLKVENGISTTTFRNIGTNSSLGLNVFGSWQIIKPWALRGSVNVYTYDVKTSAEFGSITNQQMMYNMTLMSSWIFGSGWSAEFFGLLNSPRYTAQGQTPAFSIYNFGFKKEMFKKRGSLGLNISNPFSRNFNFKTELSGTGFTQFNQFSVPFRSFNLNFSYSFGKMEFKQPRKKKSVNNDDLKQGDNSGF